VEFGALDSTLPRPQPAPEAIWLGGKDGGDKMFI